MVCWSFGVSYNCVWISSGPLIYVVTCLETLCSQLILFILLLDFSLIDLLQPWHQPLWCKQSAFITLDRFKDFSKALKVYLIESFSGSLIQHQKLKRENKSLYQYFRHSRLKILGPMPMNLGSFAGTCHYCGKVRHKWLQCWKLHGKPNQPRHEWWLARKTVPKKQI